MHFVLPSLPWRPWYVLVKAQLNYSPKHTMTSEEEKKHSEIKELREKLIELDVRAEDWGEKSILK